MISTSHISGENITRVQKPQQYKDLVLWKRSPLSSLNEALDSFTLLGLFRGLAAPAIKNFILRYLPADSISDPGKEETDTCVNTRFRSCGCALAWCGKVLLSILRHQIYLIEFRSRENFLPGIPQLTTPTCTSPNNSGPPNLSR